MSRLSKSCGLSLIYTNHSIRATGATIMSKNMYGAAQIMAVTGHKSVQSLTTYQRVDTEEKIKMVQTLTEKVTPVPEQLAFPSTEKLAITAPPTDPSKCINDQTLRSDRELCRTSHRQMSDKYPTKLSDKCPTKSSQVGVRVSTLR